MNIWRVLGGSIDLCFEDARCVKEDMKQRGNIKTDGYLLASSKTSGSSLASFSLPTSAIGPKITTGLRNPAVPEQDHGDYKQTLVLCNAQRPNT